MHRRDALRWMGFGALQLAGLNAVADSANPLHSLFRVMPASSPSAAG